MNAIHYDHVSFQYSKEVQALTDVCLSIQHGEIVGIMGRNGAGKSTLIQLLNGILNPTKGKVFIEGISTDKHNPSKLTQIIGLMFQNPEHQLFSSTVEEELNFSLKTLQIPASQKNEYKHDIVEELDLQSILHKSPWNCSGGERKKVSMACILCRKPDILVFDEPTLGQDKYGYQMLEKILTRTIEKNQTCIVVTHNTEFAAKFLKRIIVMDRGTILADGPTSEILTNRVIQNHSSIIEPQFFQLKRLLMEELDPNSRIAGEISRTTGFSDFSNIIIQYISERKPQ